MGGVNLTITVCVLVGQCESMFDEPEVVGSRLACPDCTRMIEVRSLVWGILEWATEELGRLEDHFDDVFVVLGLGC